MNRRSGPAWRNLAQGLALLGAASCAAALGQGLRTGITRPWTLLVGIAVTVAVNRVYVVVHRHGEVREGLDVAEGPLVALALILPPAEALLAFAAGCLILELPYDRAGIKKSFNVGVRITGAAAMVLPLLVVGGSGVTPARAVAATVGAALYWAIGAGCTSVLLTLVQEAKLKTVLLAGLRARLLVWAAAVAVGITGAAAVDDAPALLIGIGALVALLSSTAAACRRAQHDTERLQGVLSA